MKITKIDSLNYSSDIKKKPFGLNNRHWIISLITSAILSASTGSSIDRDPVCEVLPTYSTTVGTKLQIRDCVSNLIRKEIDIGNLMGNPLQAEKISTQ